MMHSFTILQNSAILPMELILGVYLPSPSMHGQGLCSGPIGEGMNLYSGMWQIAYQVQEQIILFIKVHLKVVFSSMYISGLCPSGERIFTFTNKQ